MQNMAETSNDERVHYHSTSPLSDVARRGLWIAIVVASSVAFAIAFECSAPYPALAALAAISMSRREALVLMVLAWLVNQAIGFGWLGYPWTANSVAWGLAIGAGALASGLVASAIAEKFSTSVPLMISVLAAAFAANEAVIFLASHFVAGGEEALQPFIVGRLFVVNLVALAGLFVLLRAGEAIGLVAREGARKAAASAA
jgi:hypothetical protein